MKLHFRKYGSGKPFVIIHGLFGISDNWQTIGKKLAEEYTIYLVDLRNHGHSPHSNEWNYQVMADDVLELLDDEGIDKAIIMGHSMGGKTAMVFADNYCERLEKLIVVDISLRRYDPPVDVLQGLNAVHLDTITSRKEVEEIIGHFISEVGVKQFLLKNLYWDDDDRLAWRFNFNAIAKNIDNIASGLTLTNTCDVPTLFIYGERSGYVRESDQAPLNQHFPSSVFTEVKNAGHWVHAENPSGFLLALLQFMSEAK